MAIRKLTPPLFPSKVRIAPLKGEREQRQRIEEALKRIPLKRVYQAVNKKYFFGRMPAATMPSPPRPTHGTGSGENVSPTPPRPPIEYIDWWSHLKPHISWTPLNQTTPDTYEYGSRPLLAAKFWLSGPKDVLSKIDRVEYYFDHPSYHPPNKIGKNASDGFTISYKAWGCIENVRIGKRGCRTSGMSPNAPEVPFADITTDLPERRFWTLRLNP